MAAKTHSPKNRPAIIQTVQTPLGFFTLVVLVVEVMFGIVAALSSRSERVSLIITMTALIVVLVAIVASLAIWRPEALGGTRPGLESKFDVPKHKWRPGVIHHVSLPVRDLAKSVNFYRKELGLPQIEPDPLTFGLQVAWFELPGGQQLHLLKNDGANFPSNGNENVWGEAHFAIRVGDVVKARERLVKRHRLYANDNVGFDRYKHFYIRDPDGHVVEVNEFPR